MKIYDYKAAGIIEISNAQYDFLQALIKSGGRMEQAVQVFPVSQEQIEEWKKDPVFWPCLEGHIEVLVKAHGLTPDYVKSFLLSTLAGQTKPTREQLVAINNSVRALGMGASNRPGFKGNLTVTPENTKLEFEDGL